jgi:hypothetical protein
MTTVQVRAGKSEQQHAVSSQLLSGGSAGLCSHVCRNQNGLWQLVGVRCGVVSACVYRQACLLNVRH